MATNFPVGADTRPAVNQIDQLVAALRKTGRQAQMSEKEIDEMVASTRRGSLEGVRHVNTFNKSFDSLNGTVNKVSGVLVTLFAVDRVMAFGRAVLSITGEFQKLEAVLTNTLGSQSKARLALIEIAKFAAQTPFAIKELTESFVKLANQGFVLTTKEMRKLGDIAASTGKEFLMLTEAIIDAQTGEFERLKEFGIRAQKEGDKVTFTFKGVKTQVDFTSEAIRGYILALGDAAGVSGSMAAISETLAGQISNAGDNFDTFFNNLGKYNKGPIGEFFRLFNEGMTRINEAMTVANMTAGDFAEIPLARFRKAFDEAKAEVEKKGSFVSLNILFQDLTHAINSVNEDIDSNKTLIEAMTAAGDGESEIVQKLTRELEIYEAELVGYREIRSDLNKVADDSNIKLAVQKKETDKAAAAERQLMIAMLARQNALKYSKDNTRQIPEDLTGVGVMTDNILDASFQKKFEEDRTAWKKFYSDERKRIEEEEQEHTQKKLKETAEKALQIAQGSLDFTLSLINTLAQARADRNAAEIFELEERMNVEIALAGENEFAKDKIRKDYDLKEKQLKQQQAQRDRNLAIFSAIINIAQGVVRALGSAAPPVNFILAALVGAAGAFQLANIKRATPQGFAEGVYDLQGPGTSTSDSIPSRLSRGEDVVPADRNKKFGFILKEIIENPALDIYDVKHMIDQKIPTQYASIMYNSAKGADSPELLEEMRATRKAIENKQENKFVFDENGFGHWVGQRDNWEKYVKSRYSF